MLMIEERIKLLEERENVFGFEEGENNGSNKFNKDDLLDENEEEKIIRLRDINMKIRKEVLRKNTKLDENQVIDKNIMNLIEKQKNNNSRNLNITVPLTLEIENKNSNNLLNVLTTKNESKKKETNFMNNNKFRNSVLQIKMNKANNICTYNNSFNKDVMNEFGNKLNFKNEENKYDFNVQVKNHNESSKNPQNTSTSLNKFFSQRNVDLTRPSPNKVFFFGVKK